MTVEMSCDGGSFSAIAVDIKIVSKALGRQLLHELCGIVVDFFVVA